MIQFIRGKNVYLGHPEVEVNILIVGVDDDIGLSDGVFAFFIHPWVQGHHVDVLNLFV